MTGWASPTVEVRETHSGVVALVGPRAYKAKKPVKTAFLDFSSHELREQALRRELDLNRRLAPDAYLGLAHVSDPLGGPAEPLLVMRRMPDERRLATRVTTGAPVSAEIVALAQLIAEFHRTARQGPEVDEAGSVDALRRRWSNNIRETQELTVLPERDCRRVQRLVTTYLAGRRVLFEDRISAGRIVDGHGDLTAEDVFCLDDGPRVLDCLDFDVALRCVDGIDDIAFMAMDLEHLGRDDLAARLLTVYRTAADDDAPVSLVHHYVAYRAFVRAKVECVQHLQGRAGADERARGYTALALSHLERGVVRLALVGGLPGTGKTTVATELAATTGATLISSDRVRHELRVAGAVPGGSGVAGEGSYTPAATDTVYTEVLRRAGELLRGGTSVVLDASWLSTKHRADAAQLATATYSRLVRLRCVAPRAAAARRITERRGGWSEVTPAIAGVLADSAGAWPEADVVDTTASLAASAAVAAAVWTGGLDRDSEARWERDGGAIPDADT